MLFLLLVLFLLLMYLPDVSGGGEGISSPTPLPHHHGISQNIRPYQHHHSPAIQGSHCFAEPQFVVGSLPMPGLN